MNPYTLALGLALGDAGAEEPKECIDALSLTVEIKPSVETYVNKQEIKATIDSALQEVQGFYQREVGLPVMWKYRTRQEHKTVHIAFGSADDCMQEWFPSVKKIRAHQIGNVEPEKQEGFKKYLSLTSSGSSDEELLEDWYSFLSRINGITDRGKKKIYVFEDHVIMPYLEDAAVKFFLDTNQNAALISHEIAHILGLGEYDGYDCFRDLREDPRPVNIMCARHLEIINLAFSDEDATKIQSQMCKPEEKK